MDTTQKIKSLVLARLRVMPEDAVLNIPGAGSFSKKDLVKHVELDDKIGDQITEIELSFLKSIKQGALYA